MTSFVAIERLRDFFAGLIYGTLAATASLSMHVIGSSFLGEDPLRLVRVYLSFGLGERALELPTGPAVALGCVLYLATGALLGSVVFLVLAGPLATWSLPRRALAAGVMGLGMWVLNAYALLSWVQPLLVGEAWIVDAIPWWLGAATHLVFVATVFLLGLPELRSFGTQSAPAALTR